MIPQSQVAQFFRDPRNTAAVWLPYLENYVSMPLKTQDAVKFRELDLWYHALDLSKGYVTKDELVEIMKWKLTRGKMRPLLSKIQALDDQFVCQVSFKAINHLRNGPTNETLKMALNELSKPLKGVGVATASAVLAKWNLEIPFMSDAGLIAVNGTTDYTLNAYLNFYQGIAAKVRELNADGTSSYIWTAKAVEHVLHIVYCRQDLQNGL